LKVSFAVGRTGHVISAPLNGLTPEQAVIEYLNKRWGRENTARRVTRGGLFIYEDGVERRVSDEELEELIYA
jgi:hypothetical protein